MSRSSSSSDGAVGASSEHIRVCVRVRPFSRRERASHDAAAFTFDSATHTMTRKASTIKSVKHPPQMKFECGTLFEENTTTEELYEKQVKDIVASSMGGINGTIFAYGQTASGKTHTMKGNSESIGVIPLAIRQVFRHIAECKDHEFLLRVSYIEIYNERVKDLLVDGGGPDLVIHESKQRGVYVNSHDEIVRSVSEVLKIMEDGEARRHYGHTEMNDLSSRSHTILRLIIESNPKTNDSLDTPRKTPSGKRIKPKVKVSTLTFVDLAGSERLAQTQAAIGSSTQVEGSYINKSLMFLGVIISRLSEGDQMALPFRESKLTRILQPSIGGNARTSIIIAVSPSISNVEHTVSSLRFGSRAITIKNHAHVNEIAADQAFMTQHQQSIEDLERRLGDMDQVEEQTAHAAELEAHASLRAEKLELEAKYLNLQRFLESAGISKERLLLSPIREGRRRHTTGGSAANTPMKESSNNQTSVDVNFVSEQLAHANQRIAQLESLLSELSNENSELLARENRHQEDAEEMLRQQEALLSQVELYSSGAGIDQMPIDQLANVEERMQEALKKVQRQIMYAEFLAMHPELNKQPTTTVDGDKGESTPDEVIDPKIAAMQEQMSQLQAQLAESSRLVDEFDAFKAAAEEDKQRKQAEIDQIESERDAALEEANAIAKEFEESRLRHSRELSAAHDTVHKYSKQLLAHGTTAINTTTGAPVAHHTRTLEATTQANSTHASTESPSAAAAAAVTPLSTAPIAPIAPLTPAPAAGAGALSDRTHLTLNTSQKVPSIGDMLNLKSAKLAAAPTPMPTSATLLSNLINKTK